MTSFTSFQRSAVSMIAALIVSGMALCAALPVLPVA